MRYLGYEIEIGVIVLEIKGINLSNGWKVAAEVMDKLKREMVIIYRFSCLENPVKRRPTSRS
ncbi:MAG: hypothetical protein QW083_02040 [Methanomassiliicoccales archaeon]